ncbi:Cytochrome P450 [Macleaya cordata]|uniref:Cytochrome P450 n=1 Tax=Macleaya cordata TaxID=56857 RepID=A0A200QUP4_MACCD|nr:Cytochrome P450 [Macleaya cordata]
MEFQSILTSLDFQLKKWPAICLGFLCCFLTIISWYFIKQKNQQVLVHWPIVDVLPSLLQNVHRVHEWTVELSNAVGGTIVGRGPIFGRSEVMFTCDPRIVEYMVKTNFPNYPKGSDFLDTFDLIGNGIFNVDFDTWQTQRRMAHTTFTSKEFRSFISNVNRNVVQEALLPLLSHVAKQSSIVDLEDVFLRFAFDSTFTVIFGRNCNYLSIEFPDDEFAKAIDDGTEAMFYRHVTPSPWWKLLRWLKLGKEKKLAEAGKTIDRHLAQYISSKREELLGGVEANDLLAVYMTSQKASNNSNLLSSSSKGDQKFLRDTALSFLFAGRDSTGTSLTWFFWLISKNPSVEAKILEELRVVALKYKNGDMGIEEKKKSLMVFDSEDLKGLVYLHAALSEALRLYPPLPMNRKLALNGDVLPNGTILKPGTKILISMYAMARMEWVWGKDCFEFKPERWIDEDGKLSHEPMTKFFVFNAGPRTCVGKEMAFTQMKSVAAAIIFNFRVEVVEGQVVQPKPSLVLHTKNGLRVRIKERVNIA